MSHRLRGLAKARDGAIAVIFALMLGVLGGLMALAMDLGKAWNLETELQHAADACALAAATQLDGLDGARARAIRACSDEVALLVQNRQKFASDGAGVDVTFDANTAMAANGTAENTDIKFYTELPVSSAVEATSDAEARFVEANVSPRRVDFAFAALVGAVTSANPRARALAGFESFYCDVPPMMMCNPAEPEGGDIGTEFNIYLSCPDNGILGDSCVGRTLTMKAHGGGGNSKLGPGDWGYLSLQVFDPNTGTVEEVKGANALGEALASVEFNAICTGNEITTEPGNMASLDRMINMRFDLYWDADDRLVQNYQPARQTRKGLVPALEIDGNSGTKWNANGGANACRFHPVTSGPNTGAWSRPKTSPAAGEERRDYRGPGMHTMVDAETCTDLGDPTTCSAGSDTVPDPFVIGTEYDGDTEMPDPPMGLVTPPIRTMAFPNDYCSYPADDGAGGGVEDSIEGAVVPSVAGCLPIEGGIQMGSGQYDAQVYLDVNHPGVTVADLLTPCPPGSPLDAPCGADLPNSVDAPNNVPDGFLSRWEIYSWEKRAEDLGTFVDYPNMPYEGKPACYKAPQEMGENYVLPESPASPGSVDRRIIVMAVVNCVGWDVKGRATVERTEPHGNIGVFLTEPMGYTDPDTLYGEIVDPRGLGIAEEDVTPDLVRERILLIE